MLPSITVITSDFVLYLEIIIFQAVTKSTSCSNLRSLWETHMAQSDLRPQSGLNSRTCPQPLNISAFQESFSKSSGSGSNPVRESVDGDLTKDAFKFFSENRSKQVPDESDFCAPRPTKSSAIAALRESLMTSSSGTSQAKKLFEAGLLTNEAVQKFTEQRSGETKIKIIFEIAYPKPGLKLGKSCSKSAKNETKHFY